MMKRIKSMHLFVALTVLLGCAGVFPLSNAAQTIPVIHVLLIIDDGNTSTGELHNVNKDLMHGLFNEICRLAADCEGTELKSSVDEDSPEWMSSGNILKWIETVDVGRDDIVCVYFSGPGGAHRKTRELYLTLPGGKFDRKVLVQAIEAIPCRLKILLTDAGSSGVSIIPTDTREPPDGIVNLQERIERDWKLDEDLFLVEVFEHLFHEHEGFVDLTASTEGEFALRSAEGGGIFTRAFWDAIFDADKLGDDGFVYWEEVFEVTKLKMHAYFELLPHALKDQLTKGGQQSQRPKYFGKLPQRITRED